MMQYKIRYTQELEETLEENNFKLISYEPKGKQIRSMQCWEIKGEAEEQNTGEIRQIKILQSYETLVAYKMNDKVYRCGHWSSTTSKQTTLWERM